MKIAIIENEGITNSVIFFNDVYRNAEELQKEMDETGGEQGEVAAFIDLPESEPFSTFLKLLRELESVPKGPLLCAMEKLIEDIFTCGKERGRVAAKENIKNSIMRSMQKLIAIAGEAEQGARDSQAECMQMLKTAAE